MTTQTIRLDVTPGGVPAKVKLSQYDHGTRTILAALFDGQTPFSIPSGATVSIMGTKADKTGFQYECEYTGNTVTIDVTEQMTMFEGEVLTELCVQDSNGEDRLGTANFILVIEPAALKDDILISKTDLPMVQEAVEASVSAKQAAARAAASAEAADHSAEDAEAYAIGTRDGEPVSSDDPAYHNNAKYQAEQAAYSATAAAGSANDAAGSARDAAGSAGDAADSAIAAAGSARDAAGSAGDAADYATAAAGYAGDAADSATAAAGSANDAAGSARDAAGSASDASDSATAAAGSANDAAGSARDAAGSAGDAADSATAAAGSATAAEQTATSILGKYPYVGNNGNWFVWNAVQDAYVDTNIPATGPQGETGPQGPQGETGQTGATGATGADATVTVGTVTTVPATSPATVTNVGTPGAAVFNFEIPQGPKGDPGTGAVNSFNGRTGNIMPASGDYSAGMVTYDNTDSGLTATDAQAAIDEVKSDLDDLDTEVGQIETDLGNLDTEVGQIKTDLPNYLTIADEQVLGAWNLLSVPANVVTQTNNGVTFTITRDSSGQVTEVDANGTAGTGGSRFTFTSDNIIRKGRYYAKNGTGFSINYQENGVVNHSGNTDDFVVDWSQDIACRIVWDIAANIQVNHVKFYPQLALKPNMPYAPYAMTNAELTAFNSGYNFIKFLYAADGDTVYSGDLNDLHAGYVYFSTSASNIPVSAYGYCLTLERPTNYNYAAQIAVTVTLSNLQLFVRQKRNHTWESWKTVTLT